MIKLGLVFALFIIFSLTSSFSQNMNLEKAAIEAYTEAADAYNLLMEEIKEIKAAITKIQDVLNHPTSAAQTSSQQITSAILAAEQELHRAENAYNELMRELRGLRAEIRESSNQQHRNITEAAPPREVQETHTVRHSGTNDIIGLGRLQKDAIVAFIRSGNPAVSASVVDSIVNIYIQEATLEDINLNIAIAQMVLATNFLRNDQRTNIHNYGGLSGASFNDRQTGIRAHIQHLKGYATTEAPKTLIVNPRYNILRQNGILGTITTRQQLYSTWAPLSRDYRARMENILSDLEQFSVRLARN